MKRYLIVIAMFLLSLTLYACAAPEEKVCEECNGMLKVECKECNATGLTECKEENCDNGVTGVWCTNCGAREGVETCSKCDGEGKVTAACTQCDGDGIIRNPITWEDFGCGNCDESGKVKKSCEKCGGHGLICNYCRKNSPNYPSEKYYARYLYCEYCNGKASVTCEMCKGLKEFPCSICAPEEYQSAMEEINAKKDKEVRQVLIEDVLTILSGITKDQQSYKAIAVDATILQQAKDALNEYEGEFEEKTALLKEIEIVENCLGAKWEYVSGDAKFFKSSMGETPRYYICGDIKFSRDENEFYLRMHPLTNDGRKIDGGVYYIKTDKEYVLEYRHGSYNRKVYGTVDGTLRFEEYDSKGNVKNSIEIKRVEE